MTKYRSKRQVAGSSPAGVASAFRRDRGAGRSVTTGIDGVTVANALTINDGVAEAVILPELGAGLASYDLFDASGRVPLFCPRRDPLRGGPFDLALNLLVPWSNRISGAGNLTASSIRSLRTCPASRSRSTAMAFRAHGWSGARRRTAPTCRSAPMAQARSGTKLARAIPSTRAPRHAALRSQSRARTAAFRPRLSPLDRAERGNAAQGQGRAGLMETHDHLPAGEAPAASRAEWDFAAPRALPSGWINNAFLGWEVARPSCGPTGASSLRLKPIRRSRPTSSIRPPIRPTSSFSSRSPIRWTPTTCPAGEANGLTILAPQETLSAACRFCPKPRPRDPVPAAPRIQPGRELHSNKRQ